MASLSDSAAMAALGSLGGGGAPMPEAMPEEMAAAPTEGGIEAGIAMIESDLAAAPPDLAEEARVHLNALREIGTQISGGGAPPAEELPPAEEMPLPGPGMEV